MQMFDRVRNARPIRSSEKSKRSRAHDTQAGNFGQLANLSARSSQKPDRCGHGPIPDLGPDNGATEPIGPLDTLASVAELVVVVFGMLALRTRRIAAPSWRWSAWSPPLRLAAPLCVAGTVAVSLLAARS
jgi:hypothetical protein